MTRLDELKQKIADSKKRMSKINTLVETEKRVKTDVERTEFDNLLNDVQANEHELKDLESVERIKIEAPVVHTSEQKAKNRTYDIVKAVNEFSERSLSGLEAELHQEIKRSYQGAKGLLIPDAVLYRTETVANSSGLIPETVSGLDIVAVPAQYKVWGVTEFQGLTSVHKMNYAEGVAADSVAEGVAFSAKTYSKSTDDLSPVAFGHSVTVSKENLAVASMLTELIADGDNAIGAKISSALLAAILANTGCTLSGYGVSASAVTMTSKIVNSLKAAVLSPLFRKAGYVMGASLYGELQETADVTLMNTIIKDGKIKGYNTYDAMSLLGVHDTNKYDLIFGDWSRGYVGTFGTSALEVLVNPYTLDDYRQIKLTFNRLADVSFNPYTFKTIRNATLA